MQHTHGEVPGTTIIGRPFKPLAVGLIIGSTVLGTDFVIHMLTDTHILTQFTPVASFFAVFAVFFIILAWVIRSQLMYEMCLLLISGIWVTRAVEIFLLGNYANAILPGALAFMAGGAYWLEKINVTHRMQ